MAERYVAELIGMRPEVQFSLRALTSQLRPERTLQALQFAFTRSLVDRSEQLAMLVALWFRMARTAHTAKFEIRSGSLYTIHTELPTDSYVGYLF